MQPAREDTVLGDFAGGRWVVRAEGPDGAPADFDVAYTFGVEPLQQYLVAFPDGRFQATSVAWDARPKREGGQRWIDLHGGEPVRPDDPMHWTSAAGNWNALCAECHSTDVQKGWRADESRYDTRWSEVSVGCEACHGPGSAHVAWAEARARSEAPPRGGDDAARGLVVRFPRDGAAWTLADGERIAKRSAPRAASPELDACGRCHARRAPLTEPYAYGRPLLDTHRPALLEADLYFDDGQIRDEVYEWGSFLQSRMHAAGVTCSDCHDVHGGAPRAEGNALCASCHRTEAYDTRAHHQHAPGSAAARCTSCHMPTRVYMQVDARHDHSLRVPRPDLSVRLGTPNACASCHADRTAAWAASAVARWRGKNAPPPRAHFAEALHAARAGAANAEGALVALATDATQPAIARATAVGELAAWLSPRSLEALQAAAGDADPLLRLAAADTLAAADPSSRVGIGAPLLRDARLAVRLAAASALAGAPPGLWTAAQRDDLARALAELRASHGTNADRPEALVSLGALHATLGEPAAARRAYETALRLAPYFVPAYVNLADLARGAGDETEAERLLDEALARAPESADVQHAVGLLRVRQGRLAEAIPVLGRAEAFAPERARYAVVHALALHEAGRTGEALRALEAAHARRPGERGVLEVLATLARDAGDLTRARAPGDDAAAALLRQVEAGAEPGGPRRDAR
jgi:tetratricopeptide (TPR) repeat protein